MIAKIRSGNIPINHTNANRNREIKSQHSILVQKQWIVDAHMQNWYTNEIIGSHIQLKHDSTVLQHD
jgi:hypothetical protein